MMQPQQVVTVSQQQQPAVYQAVIQPTPLDAAATSAANIVANFNGPRAIGLGITLVVAGVLGMIFNTVDLVIEFSYRTAPFGVIGHGFWIGIFMIITGAFGISSGRRKTRGMIQTFMIMSIVAASLSAIQFIIGVMAAIIPSSFYACTAGADESPGPYHYYRRCPRVSIAMEALLAVLAVLEAIITIISSVMGCRTACCCDGCCGDGAPITQTMIINDIPLTVVYKPQSRSMAVAYAAPNQVCQPMPVQTNVTNPPTYYNGQQQQQQQHIAVQMDTSDRAAAAATCPPSPAAWETFESTGSESEEKRKLCN